MMFLLLILLNIITGLSAVSESDQDRSAYHEERSIKVNDGNKNPHQLFKNSRAVANFTFVEKENMLRIPSTFYQSPNKKPKIKKSPKRTIQKIIKKGKTKTRRIYVNAATRMPTQKTEKVFIQENEYTKSLEDVSTTEVNRRRRLRKNTKFARYPMPFHKLQPRKDIHNRDKRETKRDDLFILKDLDEIEFLSGDNDYNIVKAHVQNYW